MATKKIEKLTAEQELLLPRFREEWFKIGCSTGRADRPRAQAAITKMYELTGEPAPTFLWLSLIHI